MLPEKNLPIATFGKRLCSSSFNFVPQHSTVESDEVDALQTFVSDSSKILILTGAGISTESGIPDYRSAGVGLYARSNHKPIEIQKFLNSHDVRKRYWARNYLGWPRWSSVTPNKAHLCLTAWEKQGQITACVTQNVDRLHQKAGTENVIGKYKLRP